MFFNSTKYHFVKFFLCVVVSVFFLFQTLYAQTKTIDSLKKVLPSLHDTARIEELALIGEHYIFYSYPINKDSALYYVSLVYEESKKINYEHGMAEAYLEKAGLANFYSDFFQAEQLAHQALKWFSLTSNKNKIAIAYWQLSSLQCKQSNYDEALINSTLCYEWAKKTGDDDRIVNALESMTDIYRERGEYDKLLEAQQKLIDREKTSPGNNTRYTIHELWVMGLMYMLLEDYPTALFYWRKLFSGKGNQFLNAWNLTEYAQLLTQANKTDSALYYYNLFDSTKADASTLRFFVVSKGEYFLCLKQYNTALPYFFKGLIYNRQLNDHMQVKRSLLDIAKTYSALYNNDSAITYARQGLSMAIHVKSKPSIRDGYEILYTVYNRLHQTDSAFYYYQNYIAMKEAVMNDQTKGKIAAYKYEHKIELMDKEKLMKDQHIKIQQQQLEQESLQKKILTGSIIGLFLIGVIIFRTIMLKRKNEKLQLENELRLQQLQNEKTKIEMQQQATALELQALRAQMNPHFIFNCLNSINRFIINNDAVKAADYLTKFAKLIRIVLEQSGKSFVPLEDEISCLKLYMDLEALRFEKPFQYTIDLNGTDVSSVMIPTMLIQPFVENAIWHGLHPKQNGTGEIDINMHLHDGTLHCSICDNGVGIKNLKEISQVNKKSLGIELTQQRLQLADNTGNENLKIKTEQLKDEHGQITGTCVSINIPYKND